MPQFVKFKTEKNIPLTHTLFPVKVWTKLYFLSLKCKTLICIPSMVDYPSILSPSLKRHLNLLMPTFVLLLLILCLFIHFLSFNRSSLFSIFNKLERVEEEEDHTRSQTSISNTKSSLSKFQIRLKIPIS